MFFFLFFSPSSGIGVLFGLADYRYEVLAMIEHAAHLEREYHAGPHTISVPRMRHAEGSDVSDAPPFPVDDANFAKLVAILRIAVPYTGMILSTRESPEMRRKLLRCGMSQMSAGSRTGVGAYHRDGNLPETSAKLSELSGQFSLMDHRPMREIVMELLRDGYVPSWCTACYRKVSLRFFGGWGELTRARQSELSEFFLPSHESERS